MNMFSKIVWPVGTGLARGAWWAAKSGLGWNSNMGTAANVAAGTAGRVLLGAYEFASHSRKFILGRYPQTYASAGFGAGFGANGGHMPPDGGIGATGDLVLNSRTRGVF